MRALGSARPGLVVAVVAVAAAGCGRPGGEGSREQIELGGAAPTDGSWRAAMQVAVNRHGPGHGDYAVVGHGAERGGSQDAFVERYDREGRLLWRRTHAGPGGGTDHALGVAFGSEGEVVVAGSESVGPAWNLDIWVRKYDRDGNVVWTARHAGPGDQEHAYGVAVGPDGGVVAAGVRRPSGRNDVWLARYHRDGRLLWTRTLGGRAGGHDGAQAVALDANGDLAVAGYESAVPSPPGWDAFRPWITKLDRDGRALWSRTLDRGGRGPSGATAVSFARHHDLVVSGELHGARSAPEGFVARLDRRGQVRWLVTAPDLGARSLALRHETVYLVGSVPSARGDDDIFIGALDARDGSRLWSTTREGHGRRDGGYGVAVWQRELIAVGYLRSADDRLTPYVERLTPPR